MSKLIAYISVRLSMISSKKLIEEDLVIASGIVEGAARYVIGERMDCSGMRWIPSMSEALLHLRCVELNGEWESFFEWEYKQWLDKMKQGEKVLIRQEKPDTLKSIESLHLHCANADEFLEVQPGFQNLAGLAGVFSIFS